MNNSLEIKDTTANPGPLGLSAFGLTTILLNLHNVGFFGLDSMILAMGLFYGGISQLMVGMLEWKKNNLFGLVAFTSYGAFWLTLVFLILLPKMELAAAPSSVAMGSYLAVWGIFSLFLFIGTLKMNKVMQYLFGTLVVLFFLLAISDFAESAMIKTIAGIDGIICGSIAIYAAMAEVLKSVYGRTVLPV